MYILYMIIYTAGGKITIETNQEKKCLGGHWESNPRPLILAVDALTTELRLINPQQCTL